MQHVLERLEREEVCSLPTDIIPSWNIQGRYRINTEGSKKMYSFFDSQYLWKKVTYSYNSCAKSESLYVFEVTTISG
jgi:hypothetical protein